MLLCGSELTTHDPSVYEYGCECLQCPWRSLRDLARSRASTGLSGRGVLCMGMKKYLALAILAFASFPAHAQIPVKVGFHGALTGPNSVDGLADQIATQTA